METNSSPSTAEICAREYDYVIIGGGTAGLVLASRLTEEPSKTVIVLEAGEERLGDPQINIPALFTSLYGDEKYDWNFQTAPQSHMNNRVLSWPRGKVLGGSSAINFLMHSHASATDLDNWEKLGNAGWNFDALQPYYRKSETYNPPTSETAAALGTHTIDPMLHGKEGPVQTSFPEGSGQLDHAWNKTFANLGYGVKGDPRKGATLGGYSLLKHMDRNARRSYAATAYYLPIAGRENLTVLTGAHVNKVCLSATGPDVTATGVNFSVAGEDFTVRTRGEVIVCAGAIQSPQILELSGIGARGILEKYGINVVVDNPNVGENLQDHLLVPLAYATVDDVPTSEALKLPGVLDWAMQEWQTKGAGPLATGVTGTSFLSYSSILPSTEKDARMSRLAQLLEQAKPTPAWAGLSKQLQLQTAQLFDEGEADLQINFGATGVNPKAGNDLANLFTHDDSGGFAGFVTAQTHALSRGFVHIQSSDSITPPIIDPRYLSHPVDLELMVAGMQFTQTLTNTEPMASLLKNNPHGTGKIIQPAFGVSETEGLTEETTKKLIMAASATSFHPVGTCSMLPLEDGGVVDSNLKVYGTTNMRVVDASIFPLNVRGNIASLVYAVAERGADLIKGQ